MGQGEFFLLDCIYHGLWLCLVRKGEFTFKDLSLNAAPRKDGVDCGQLLVEGPGVVCLRRLWLTLLRRLLINLTSVLALA